MIDADPSVRSLWRRSGAVLAVVAALLVLDQAVVAPPLLRLMGDAPVINVAGRQRMLSQRLAKAALAVEATTGPAREAHLGELRAVLGPWSRAHEGLRRGDPGLALPGHNSPEVDRALDDLEPSFRAIRDAARRLADPAAPPEARRRDLDAILAHEGDYLAQMDRIVGLYEREARDRAGRLLRTGWALAALALACVAAAGWLVLRPATRMIEVQLRDLRAARDHLEHRVRERTAALERANALVEQYGQAARANTLGEMAIGLGHELNQPLGAVANYVEGCLVALDAPEPDLAAIRGALDKALATTLRAGAILQRIRRFVTRRGPARESFDPAALLAETAELCGPELARRGVALRLDLASGLPWGWGDPVQVQQVLANLARNAADAIAAAEPQPATPEVILGVRPGPDGGLEFAVADNGEGIAPDRLPRIFDAFFSTRAEGMGMGLAISRTIVESHGGRIEAASGPGHGPGATFRFTISRAPGDDAFAGTDRLDRR